jgi:hypothetical protein
LALSASVVIGGAWLATAQARGRTESVSLIRLIANPERYHGKKVRVIGFARLQFEGSGVYVHEDDYRHGITRNGLWLGSFASRQGRQPTDPISIKGNDKYAIVEGTFDMNNHGHRGMWSGAITNVTRFQLWSDPNKPRHLPTAAGTGPVLHRDDVATIGVE